MRASHHSILAYADGASRGNPGPAAIGAVLATPEGAILHTISRPTGRATAAEAEWRAAVAALEAGLGLGARRVTLLIDSPVVAAQAAGRRAPRNPVLRRLWARYRQLRPWFDRVELRCVPRAEVGGADQLARAALVGQSETARDPGVVQ